MHSTRQQRLCRYVMHTGMQHTCNRKWQPCPEQWHQGRQCSHCPTAGTYTFHQWKVLGPGSSLLGVYGGASATIYIRANGCHIQINGLPAGQVTAPGPLDDVIHTPDGPYRKRGEALGLAIWVRSRTVGSFGDSADGGGSNNEVAAAVKPLGKGVLGASVQVLRQRKVLGRVGGQLRPRAIRLRGRRQRQAQCYKGAATQGHGETPRSWNRPPSAGSRAAPGGKQHLTISNR